MLFICDLKSISNKKAYTLYCLVLEINCLSIILKCCSFSGVCTNFNWIQIQIRYLELWTSLVETEVPTRLVIHLCPDIMIHLCNSCTRPISKGLPPHSYPFDLCVSCCLYYCCSTISPPQSSFVIYFLLKIFLLFILLVNCMPYCIEHPGSVRPPSINGRNVRSNACHFYLHTCQGC